MATTATKAALATARKTEPPAPAAVQQPGNRRAGAASARLGTLLSPRVQTALTVSSPRDPAEREAESMARHVMAMPEPAPRVTLAAPGLVARQAAAGAAAATGTAEIEAASGGGAELPRDLRGFMERRFRADFSTVRVHADDRAARLANRMGARAFAYGKHLFFARDQYQPDTPEGGELIAHELTHTIQQGVVTQGGPMRETVPESRGPSPAPTVTQSAPARVQRFGLSDVLDYFADKANNIPGYRMFTVILGVNPINMSRVERSAANILRALVEFMPGGHLIVQALDKYGVFDRAGAWIEQQIAALGLTGAAIRDSVMDFIDSLGWRDVFHPLRVWERAVHIFTDPIDRLISLARNAVSYLVSVVKDAILKPLAELASRTRAWDLLIAVLGRNPITGEAVPRTADTLIGGFMKLIGQEEIWNNIKRAKAISRAWAWFQGVLTGVLAFVTSIPDRFLAALRSLEISDIILLPRAFAKVGAAFASFVGDFIGWAGRQVLSLLEIIFEVVAPAVIPYIKKAAGAFRTIISNPVRFIGLLVRAGIQGFKQFAGNFLRHLRNAVVGWLTGAMSGANIYVPQSLSFVEIIKFVLSVLGLTWQNVRAKLVRAVGETAVRAMEAGFDIIVTLVRDGPAAAWQKILEGLSNLREMVMEQVMSFVRDTIVQRAITTLLTSLNPAGAFIQAVIATYNTIMFFVERLRQIAQVAAAFVDAIATIAAGNIKPAADRVETTMAGLLVLVISFLARIAGLGKVSDAVTSVINRVREPIDRGLDRIVNWIVEAARKLGRFVAQVGVPQDPEERLRLAGQASVQAARALGNRFTGAALQPALAGIKLRYALTDLQVFQAEGRWKARISINPLRIEDLGPSVQEARQGVQATLAENAAEGAETLTDAQMVSYLTRIWLHPLTQWLEHNYDRLRAEARNPASHVSLNSELGSIVRTFADAGGLRYVYDRTRPVDENNPGGPRTPIDGVQIRRVQTPQGQVQGTIYIALNLLGNYPQFIGELTHDILAFLASRGGMGAPRDMPNLESIRGSRGFEWWHAGRILEMAVSNHITIGEAVQRAKSFHFISGLSAQPTEPED